MVEAGGMPLTLASSNRTERGKWAAEGAGKDFFRGIEYSATCGHTSVAGDMICILPSAEVLSPKQGGTADFLNPSLAIAICGCGDGFFIAVE
jgi:hypothetical protein